MNAQNYDALMRKQAERSAGGRLLMHCCCAPCSTACLERLKDLFKISVLFYNPNIETEEYARRKEEILNFIAETGWADVIDCDSIQQDFYSAVKGLENAREGGERCLKCFELRLKKTSEIADNYGYDFFTSTLTVSPLKNAEAVNKIGESLQNKARWLYSDFKKRGGYLRSVELSKEYSLYRQNYCGCVFSRRDREMSGNRARNINDTGDLNGY